MIKSHEHIIIKTKKTAFKEAERKLKVLFEKLHISESATHDLLVSASEVVMNAVQHGNKNDPAKNISIDVDFKNNEITLAIEDQGGGFDPAALPDPLLPENLLKPSGRGIHIVKSLMDSVEFEFTPHGTRTVMKLKVNAGKR